MPKTTKPKRDSAPRIEFKCNCHIRGRLRRSSDRKSLFLECSDGTMLTVSDIGRGAAKSRVWLFCHADLAFNDQHLWLVYPESHSDGSDSVTAVAIVDGRDRPEDVLEFSASIGNLEKHPGMLPLFIGRNHGPGYNFLNLQIPEGFDLPNLKARQPVQGTARRQGDKFVLERLGEGGDRDVLD